jgi:hypothetical protein
MGESTKAVSAFVMILASMAVAVAWTVDRPDGVTWAFRIASPAVALLALGLILKLHFRKDLAPDYLRPIAGTYYNRDGFCFTVTLSVADGVAYLDAYFQNQRDAPSRGRIALRPGRGFWMGRAEISVIAYDIECAPGAFGVARVALPIPKPLQGKRQSFEVGASVKYPQGKGRLLRFHDGMHLRANSDFGDAFRTAVTVAGAMGGAIVLSSPAKVKLTLPADIAETIPADAAPIVKTLWKLGDPPLVVSA